MRVELTIDGGFAAIPGLARPMVADDADLAAADARELRRLCRAALATPTGSAAARPGPMPDARRYRLAIEVDGATQLLVATDPIGQPALAELIDFVRARGAR